MPVLTTPTSPKELPSHDEQDERASAVGQRQEVLASAFRDLMTKGQSLERSNAYRRSFYQEVIKLATEVNRSDFNVYFLRITNLRSMRPGMSVKKLSGKKTIKMRGKSGGYTIQEGNFVNL
jgi:hypothetical protein